MPRLTVPPRASLEAETDQGLAWFRDPAHRFEGAAGGFCDEVAASVSAHLREEFPETPCLGRVVMAVVQSLTTAGESIGVATGKPVPAGVLLTIAALAAVELEDGEAGHG